MSESATLQSLTERVRQFVKERDWEQFHSPRNLAMALSVECAELLELYLWCTDGGPQPIHEGRKDKVEEEAADVLICLLNFCDQAGIDLSDALDKKLAAAQLKYPADRVKGKALKYNEYDQ